MTWERAFAVWCGFFAVTWLAIIPAAVFVGREGVLAVGLIMGFEFIALVGFLLVFLTVLLWKGIK